MRTPATAVAAPALIGALLRRPTEVIQQRIVREAHRAGFTDLVLAHLAVVRYPGPDGRRPSELAAEVGMTKQAMNYLLGQLEQLGYLTRSEDADDQRSKRIHLTDRGEALLQTIRGIVTQIEQELEAELGTNAYGHFRRLLIRLNATETITNAGHDS